MRFQCPFCQFISSADPVLSGELFTCPSCTKPLKVPTGLQEGVVIGDFVIQSKIGSGSIGTVYKATQLSLGRTVALKVLSSESVNQKGLEDFLSEARAAAKLNHTNLVQALSVGDSDGYCYMAMTLLTGITVKMKIKQGPIPVDEALHIVQQVAEALHYAWQEAKLIHRDVKPENIILTDEGIAKLTDLGLAMREKDWREGMEISGSPSYMSPEQFYGEKLDSRSDIYSLGITLYQMLSGQLPFKSPSVRSLALQHIQEEAVPLSKLNLRIPPMVSALVKKMIAKRVEERFQSMEDLLGQIWKIRQKTAPDKDLVPSVHTISIRRLDYDRQLDSQRNLTPKTGSAANNFYPFGPGGPAVPVKIKGHGGLLTLLLIALFVMVGIGFYLFSKNLELTHQLQEPSDLTALRKRVEHFCVMVDKQEASSEYIEQQARTLTIEIESLEAEPELATLVKQALKVDRQQRELKRTAEFESKYQKSIAALDEKNKALADAQKTIADIKAGSANENELLTKLSTATAALFSGEKDALMAEIDSRKIHAETLSAALGDCLKNIVFDKIRTRNPAEGVDYMSIINRKLLPFNDTEYAFYRQLAQLAAKVDYTLRRGVGITGTGRVVQINGVNLTLTGVVAGNFTFVDEQRQVVPVQASRLSPREVYQILRPVFRDVDSSLVIYSILVARGEVGDALAYADSDPLRINYVTFLIENALERMRNAYKDNPERAVEYERSIFKMIGASEALSGYLTEAENIIAGAKAVIPQPTPRPVTDTPSNENVSDSEEQTDSIP